MVSNKCHNSYFNWKIFTNGNGPELIIQRAKNLSEIKENVHDEMFNNNNNTKIYNAHM